MICGRGMSSDAGGRPEVKGMTEHPPAVCSRVWPRRRKKNDDRRNGETCSWCVEEKRAYWGGTCFKQGTPLALYGAASAPLCPFWRISLVWCYSHRCAVVIVRRRRRWWRWWWWWWWCSLQRWRMISSWSWSSLSPCHSVCLSLSLCVRLIVRRLRRNWWVAASTEVISIRRQARDPPTDTWPHQISRHISLAACRQREYAIGDVAPGCGRYP